MSSYVVYSTAFNTKKETNTPALIDALLAHFSSKYGVPASSVKMIQGPCQLKDFLVIRDYEVAFVLPSEDL